MTDTIFAGQTPNQPADTGGVSNRSVGNVWRTSASGKRITSGRYWVPAEGIGTGSLYQIWDGSTGLYSIDLITAIPSPTLNAFNNVPYPSAFDPAANHDYVVCAALDGASYYRYSTGMTFPVGSGGSVSASTAIYAENLASIGSGPPTNTGFSGGIYFVDVNVEDAAVAAAGISTVILLGSSVVKKIAQLTGFSSAAPLVTSTASKVAISSSSTAAIAGATSSAAKSAVAAGNSAAIAGVTVQAARVASVSGRCVAVAGGYRSASSSVVTRPSSGTIGRPFSGTVARP